MAYQVKTQEGIDCYNTGYINFGAFLAVQSLKALLLTDPRFDNLKFALHTLECMVLIKVFDTYPIAKIQEYNEHQESANALLANPDTYITGLFVASRFYETLIEDIKPQFNFSRMAFVGGVAILFTDDKTIFGLITAYLLIALYQIFKKDVYKHELKEIEESLEKLSPNYHEIKKEIDNLKA